MNVDNVTTTRAMQHVKVCLVCGDELKLVRIVDKNTVTIKKRCGTCSWHFPQTRPLENAA